MSPYFLITLYIECLRFHASSKDSTNNLHETNLKMLQHVHSKKSATLSHTWKKRACCILFSSISNKMQCYTIYFCEMFYMFQAVPPPIIKSSKLYTEHRVKPLLLPATTVAGSSKGLTKYPMLYIHFLNS